MLYEGSKQSDFSRVAANELAKGYYATDKRDLAFIRKILKPAFGWKSRTNSNKTLTVFDPCAGEGEALFSLKRSFQIAYKEARQGNDCQPCEIATYAVELDGARCARIKGVNQAVNASFFDTTTTAPFSVGLINPPYNRNDSQMLAWIQKAAGWLSHRGLMVLILPDYEFHRQEIQEYVGNTYNFIYAFRSENYAQYKQLVVFLSKKASNRADQKGPYRGCRMYGAPSSNFDNREYRTFSEFFDNGGVFEFTLDPETTTVRPLIEAKNLEGVYQDCAALSAKMAKQALDMAYPAPFDTSLTPLASLRTAHAVQLAAMNSDVESVTINGKPYLAKYMVSVTPETYEDPESETSTIVYKPEVQSFLMDNTGKKHRAKDLGFDYYELNSYLSEVLLRRLSRTYKPLHEVGTDPDFLKEDLDAIGLMPPQKEAVKAIIKGYRSGIKGLGIRANTGTGKSWMAKAVNILLESKRTVMVTEPHLVPVLANEYQNEPFDVHVIDSWEKMKELEVNRPEGLYLIAYTRLRMHPKWVPALIERRVMVRTESGALTREFRQVCPDCLQAQSEKLRKGDKNQCEHCGSALYTYVSEGEQKSASYKDWIRAMEGHRPLTHRSASNAQLPYINSLKKIGFDLACFDEAHNASNLSSNQGSAFIRLASSSARVLVLTATVTNGLAKSLYNILWGLDPLRMESEGWSRTSSVDFQAQFGAFKEIRKSDKNNRHRGSERVTTHDTAGISPAVLAYTLSRLVNVDSSDFTDMPPVEREVINCEPDPQVIECMREIEDIIDKANLPPEDKLAAISVRNAAFLRVADTFCHFNDELKLRGVDLGTLRRRTVTGLLDKEQKLVDLVKGVLERGERVIVYTGNTQKCDMRPVIRRVLEKHTMATIDVLADSVPAKKVEGWFEKAKGDVALVSYKRVGTGLSLSQYNNVIWYDYTNNSRAAEQGDGRIRRVNTVQVHRELFGAVRACRYFYLISGDVQSLQLSYTLEKRMVSTLAEGEIPDLDPADCTCGEQSFSGLLTRALQRGQFEYADPSELLKKMTKAENARIEKKNLLPATVPVATPKVEPVQAKASRPKETKRVAPVVPTEQMNLFGDWVKAA